MRTNFYPRLTSLAWLAAGFALALLLPLIIDLFGSDDARRAHLAKLSLEQAIEQIRQVSVEEVDENAMANDAIRQMLISLDDHSELLEPDQYTALLERSQGEFVGVGLEVGLRDKYFTVIGISPDSPAARADIAIDDRIVGIDGEPVKGMQMRELLRRITGEAGAQVTLKLFRSSLALDQESDQELNQRKVLEADQPSSWENASFDVTLTRQKLTLRHITAQRLEGDIGLLELRRFNQASAQTVREELEQMDAELALKGMILDLRSNPGGLLTAAVAVADLFLQQGKIVATHSPKLAEQAHIYRATKGDILRGRPLVVLIDQGSASASEVVAGALQDNVRAVLMGSRSYGKGSVQSLMPPLANGSALRITTAFYTTPSGTEVQSRGIEPDVSITATSAELIAAARQQVLLALAQNQNAPD